VTGGGGGWGRCASTRGWWTCSRTPSTPAPGAHAHLRTHKHARALRAARTPPRRLPPALRPAHSDLRCAPAAAPAPPARCSRAVPARRDPWA
jgi:hypothetical protein